MKSILLAAAACAALAPIGSAARADATSDARAAIQSQYNRESAAAIKKNSAGVLAVYAPDFQATTKQGQVLKMAQLKQLLQFEMSSMSGIKNAVKIKKFTLKGKTATATIADHTEAMVTDPRSKKSAKLVADDVSEDIWEKTGKGWLKKRSRTITSKDTLNGKPVGG